MINRKRWRQLLSTVAELLALPRSDDSAPNELAPKTCSVLKGKLERAVIRELIDDATQQLDNQGSVDRERTTFAARVTSPLLTAFAASRAQILFILDSLNDQQFSILRLGIRGVESAKAYQLTRKLQEELSGRANGLLETYRDLGSAMGLLFIMKNAEFASGGDDHD